MSNESSERNKQLVQSLYRDCLNSGQFSLADELIAPDFVGAEGEKGPTGFAHNIEGLRAAFPDIHFTVEDMIAEGDRVVVRWRWEATHDGSFRGIAATHKHVKNTGIAVYQIRDQKIVRAWAQIDRLGVLQQIGVVPTNLTASSRTAQR
jgi:steroid delta-isomerase-like uncharacterized protein